MKRMFGMMPSSEVELRESYKDNFGLTVRIEAGNRDIIKNDVDLSIAEKWTLSGMFQDGCKPVEVSGGSRLSGQNKFLLHRCDPEKLCICDFIGWKEIEDKND